MTSEKQPNGKRRTFLQMLFGAPVAAAMPAPKEAKMVSIPAAPTAAEKSALVSVMGSGFVTRSYTNTNPGDEALFAKSLPPEAGVTYRAKS